MEHQIPLTESARAHEIREDGAFEVTPDLAYKRIAIVNVVFYGPPAAPTGNWVLIDTGVAGPAAARLILNTVHDRFGEDSRPVAIIQTHGHFDHVGALESLAERWDVPVYAHPLELPYLNGTAHYPPPDPSVGGGMMSRLSGLFPRGPVNVSRWLSPLPTDGTVPGMPDWRWIHTPGHTPGHISLWRESDRTIIAGDAFITTKQESAYAALTQELELHGPPMYYTQDWDAARDSVERLAALQPDLAITGHGHAIHGAQLRSGLHDLAVNFDRVAVPPKGKYVDTPATPADGSAYRRN